MKRYVGIGDLILDVYHNNSNELIGYYPGGSVWNDLFHLKKIDSSNECFAVGTCGKDESTPFIINTLINAGINVDYLNYVEKPVNKFHIIVNKEQTISQAECPTCKKKSKYTTNKYPSEMPILFGCQDGDNYVIIDSMKKNYLNLAKSFADYNWRIAIDIGYLNYLRYLNKTKLEELFRLPIYYLQTNPKVCGFLSNKFGQNSIKDLYETINVKYLCVTDGEYGSTFFWKDDNNEVQSAHCDAITANVVDTTGAGDAFFSIVLQSITSDGTFLNNINSILYSASSYAKSIIEHIGAQAKYDTSISFSKGCPDCGYVESNPNRIKTKRQTIAINTNHLYDRILRALDSDAEEKISKAVSTMKGTVITVGTGGSFTSAVFVSKLLNEYKEDVYSTPCHPRDFMFENYKKINAAILFSYSGKTNDILSVYNTCRKNGISVYVITKMTYDSSVEFYQIDDVISYSASIINSRERGFISMAGTLIPMVLFGKLFYQGPFHSFEDFLKECFNARALEYNNEFDFHNINNKLTIDIFSGADTKCAAIDLESKVIESGIGRATIHDKKDFSHGRFNVLQECPPDLVVVFNNCAGQYSEKLLKYLKKKKEIPCLQINSNYGNIWGDFDIIIAIQFFLKHISKIMRYDMARPSYPQDAMSLYKYHKDDIL